MKLAFVAFQRPVAPSCCHNWPMVSRIESGRRRWSLWAEEDEGAATGVERPEVESGVWRLRLDFLEGDDGS